MSQSAPAHPPQDDQPPLGDAYDASSIQVLRGLGAEVEVAPEGADAGPFAAAIAARFAAGPPPGLSLT